MAKDPTYPMYAQDFDMDTAVLTNEEVGVYLRLLNACWINKGLPTDLKKMARICRISEQDFMIIWEEIKDKFFLSKGIFLNKKQEEVREFRLKQKANGNKGGRPKKEQYKNPNKTQTKPKQNLSNEIEIEIEKEIEIKKELGILKKESFEISEILENWLIEKYDFQSDERTISDLNNLSIKITNSFIQNNQNYNNELIIHAAKHLIDNLPAWIKQNKFSPDYWVSKYSEIYQGLKNDSNSNNKYSIDAANEETRRILLNAI